MGIDRLVPQYCLLNILNDKECKNTNGYYPVPVYKDIKKRIITMMKNWYNIVYPSLRDKSIIISTDLREGNTYNAREYSPKRSIFYIRYCKIITMREIKTFLDFITIHHDRIISGPAMNCIICVKISDNILQYLKMNKIGVIRYSPEEWEYITF